MRRILEYQIERIEAVLARHRVDGRVSGGSVTPHWIRFQLHPTATGVRLSVVRELVEELAAALDAPAVRVSRRGAAVEVEVPRGEPRPVRLLPLVRALSNWPPLTAMLGLAEDGVPLLMRLSSPDAAHVLVGGMAGAGKTTLLRAVVLSLALRHPLRGELLVVLIDPGGTAFSDLAALPCLARPIVSDPGETGEVLRSLGRMVDRRQQRGETQPPVVVVVDELVELMRCGGAQAERGLTRLLERGPGAGMHVVAATASPTSACLGGLIEGHWPLRVVGRTAGVEEARAAGGLKGTGAERLLGRGDFIAVAGERLHRFQAAYVAVGEAAEALGALRGAAAPAYRARPLERSPLSMPR